jgi:PAS domain S-box-containing protein
MAVLLLFLAILDVGIVSQQRKLLIERTNEHFKDELNLLSEVTLEALLKHDYVSVKLYLERWGAEDMSFSEIRAVAPNGFVLAEFTRPLPANVSVFHVKKQVKYEETDLVVLELVGNHLEVERIINTLNRRLIISSAIFMVVMGIALWYSQKKVALVPMEKEIERRREAEEKLQNARDELEIRVEERTAKLKNELMVRQLAEDALRTSEEQVRLLLNSTAEAMYGVDTEEICTFVNPSCLRMLGYEKEEDLLGKNMHEMIHHTRIDGSKYPREECRIHKAFRSQKGTHVDDEVFWRADGSFFHVEYWSYPIFREGKVVGSVVTFLDITKRKQSEEALRESWEKYRSLFESANDSIFIIDPASIRILDANENAAKRLGYSHMELLKLTVNDIDSPKSTESNKKIFDELQKKGNIVYEHVHLRKDGSEIPVEISSQVIEYGKREVYQLFVRDISERKKLENELLKADKLESLGVLAGGLAHDFNNLLTAILGNISLAKMYITDPDKAQTKLKEAEKAALRTRDLNQQLLTFSKGGVPVMRVASIGHLIKESVSFVLSGSNVKCDYVIPDDLLHVEIDEGQMSQVINNIIINADHSMPEGGTVKVICENVKISIDDRIPLQEGNYVRVSISDQGTGIPKDHLRKIFDPYFTTKQKGSGLGLAGAFSIVKRHKGHIEVESELGEGTTFRLYLLASSKKASVGKEPEGIHFFGEGRILVMDDERIVRDVAGDMLTGLGYEVEYARDGKEAIQMYRDAIKSDSPFDVVIMDLTIPGGMGGKETIKALIDIDPDIKAIVSSGYSNDPIMSKYNEYGFSGVVMKPYRVHELSRTLHGVITGSTGTSGK